MSVDTDRWKAQAGAVLAAPDDVAPSGVSGQVGGVHSRHSRVKMTLHYLENRVATEGHQGDLFEGEDFELG